MLTERLIQLGELLEQLRTQVRPEGDAAYGAVRTALDQAKAAAADMGAPVPPTPIEVELSALRADLAKLGNLPVQVSTVGADVTAIRGAVGI